MPTGYISGATGAFAPQILFQSLECRTLCRCNQPIILSEFAAPKHSKAVCCFCWRYINLSDDACYLASLFQEEVPKMAARIFYIEHGPEVDLELVRTRIDEYLPKAMLANSKSRDQLIRSVMLAFKARGYSNGVLSTRQV